MPFLFRFPAKFQDRTALLLAGAGLAGMAFHFMREPSPAPGPGPPLSGKYTARPDRPRPATAPAASRVVPGVREMRQRLREFILPDPAIKSLPLPDALAVLEQFWRELPHASAAVPPAAFVLDPRAADLFPDRSSAPEISLEIPDVSLLTHLGLLAAQAGLELTITPDGAVFSPLPDEDDTADSTAVALSQVAVDTWLKKADARNPAGSMNPYETHAPDRQPGEMEVEATVQPDGTIDLQMTGELVEFEGFINYESPIQTTGVSALAGLEEPVVLTDSRVAPRGQPDSQAGLEEFMKGLGIGRIPVSLLDLISETPEEPPAPGTEPVVIIRRNFRTGLGYYDLGIFEEAQELFQDVLALDPQNTAALRQLEKCRQEIQAAQTDPTHRSYGRSGYCWLSEAGKVRSWGPPRTRRVVAAAAAALEESAQAGMRLEIRPGNQDQSQPPPLPSRSPAGTDAPPRPGQPRTSRPLNQSSGTASGLLRIPVTISLPSHPADRPLLPEPGQTLQSGAWVHARGALMDVHLFPQGPAASRLLEEPMEITLVPGVWTRLDLPPSASGAEPWPSFFIRARRIQFESRAE